MCVYALHKFPTINTKLKSSKPQQQLPENILCCGDVALMGTSVSTIFWQFPQEAYIPGACTQTILPQYSSRET